MQQAWEVKEVHSKQNGLGLQGGQSLAMSFSDAADFQVYTSRGAQLAGLSSSGKPCQRLGSLVTAQHFDDPKMPLDDRCAKSRGEGVEEGGGCWEQRLFTADVRLY